MWAIVGGVLSSSSLSGMVREASEVLIAGTLLCGMIILVKKVWSSRAEGR
jgi:hypothetical protein